MVNPSFCLHAFNKHFSHPTRKSLMVMAFIVSSNYAIAAMVPTQAVQSKQKTSQSIANTQLKPPSQTTNTTTLAQPKTTLPKLVDWTPVLKTMQNGCDLPDIENASDEMKATIINDSAGRGTTSIADGYKTLTLQNASAWGYPIKRIQYGSQGPSFSSATVYFTDNRFLNLRSKFYVDTVAGKLTAQNKTIIKDSNAFAGQYLANGMGYNDGRSGVNFSQKTNSITCSWAHL